VDDDIGGVLLLDDELRGDAIGSMSKLKSLGITPVMLTGDKAASAKRIASAAGIDKYHAGLLPEDKAQLLCEASWQTGQKQPSDQEAGLLGSESPVKKRGPVEVGFVGDGLNDCIALANANVGIVMQEIGSAATVDAASVVLQGDLGQLTAAVIIARRAQRLVIANIVLALSINAIVIIIAATRGLPLWLSVLMDSGTLLLVLLNSLWPLCWRVEPVPKSNEAELTESGGVIAFKARGISLDNIKVAVQ